MLMLVPRLVFCFATVFVFNVSLPCSNRRTRLRQLILRSKLDAAVSGLIKGYKTVRFGRGTTGLRGHELVSFCGSLGPIDCGERSCLLSTMVIISWICFRVLCQAPSITQSNNSPKTRTLYLRTASHDEWNNPVILHSQRLYKMLLTDSRN